MEKHIVESINESAIVFMRAFSDAAQKAASAIAEFGQALAALDSQTKKDLRKRHKAPKVAP